MLIRTGLRFNSGIKRTWLHRIENQHSPQVVLLFINYSQSSSTPFAVHQTKRHFNQDVKWSSISVNGKNIKIYQHYFDQPVPQPRSPKGQRRIADLTGLKGSTTIIIFDLIPSTFKGNFGPINSFILNSKISY